MARAGTQGRFRAVPRDRRRGRFRQLPVLRALAGALFEGKHAEEVDKGREGKGRERRHQSNQTLVVIIVMSTIDDPPAAKRGRTESTPSTSTSTEVRALEFYCGVGGLHYSLLRARSNERKQNTSVVGSFDINPHANDVYAHNFGTRPIANSLSAIPSTRFDKLNANLWLMSPPCQPFTRQGAQKDTTDGRSQSFLRLIDILPELKNKPSHLLVENVVGFEVSDTRNALLQVLRDNGFTYKEFILSPRMFGVPYSRPRYFCIAKRKELKWAMDEKFSSEIVHREPPPCFLSDPKHWVKAPHIDDLEPTNPTEARPIANSLSAIPSTRFDKLNANLWLMSPPCQPFTRQGAQKDTTDGRSQSFLRLIDILPELKNKPSHLLVENVVGFEVSDTRNALLQVLRDNGFTYKEFILSPRMFGVPYSRPRYFCIAKRKELKWAMDEKFSSEIVHREPPPCFLSDPKHWVKAPHIDDLEPTNPTEATVARLKREEGQTAEEAAKVAKEHAKINNAEPKKTYGVATLEGFLEVSSIGKQSDGSDRCDRIDAQKNVEESSSSLYSEYAVPVKELQKAKLSVSAVLPSDRKCNCFTKSYGKFVKGTGSFLVEEEFDWREWDGQVGVVDGSGDAADGTGDGTGDGTTTSNTGDETVPRTNPQPPRARYFTPREVANIHSFPPDFTFPPNITTNQQFALLGNSLSVACVAPLLEYLLNDQ